MYKMISVKKNDYVIDVLDKFDRNWRKKKEKMPVLLVLSAKGCSLC